MNIMVVSDIDIVAPNGNDILGTYEWDIGRASVTFSKAEPLTWEHDGYSISDETQSIEIDGIAMFVDDDWDFWLEHHLVPEGTELADDTIAAMRAEAQWGLTIFWISEARENLRNAHNAAPNLLDVVLDRPLELVRITYEQHKKTAAELKARDLANQPCQS
jgi:hypothetical protein